MMLQPRRPLGPVVQVVVAVVVVGASVACEGATDPAAPAVGRDPLALFQTDSLHYTLSASSLGHEARVGVVFTNRTPRTAYFVNCNGATSISLEKLAGDQWQAVWTPPIPSCLSQPVTVPPGGSYRTDLRVFGARPGSNIIPQFTTTDLTGVFRLVWHEVVYDYQDRLPWGEPLPRESTVSNRFTLTAASP
jgi:hypothetical protein